MEEDVRAGSKLRRRGSLSARLPSQLPAPNTTEVHATAVTASDNQDGFPCPRQIKPLLHFYKYLQPLPDGRKLQLQLPPTVVCDKRDGREEVLSLRTDANGFAVKDDKGPAWRKRLLSDFLGEDQQNAASLLTVGMDDVVAVRNVAHWRSTGTGGGINSKSLVLTRRAFDVVVNAPCDLAFSIQKYVRCRGCHASIFRVTWGERENRRFAINIFNENKVTEAPSPVSSGKAGLLGDARPQGTPFDAALRQMAQLSPYYLVTATSGADLKRQQEHAKLPRIRGSPVAEGLQAVKRIVDHFTAQLPGIKVREVTADFIKDSRGVWWFIRVMHFDACYRVEVPPLVQNNNEIDSAAYIHDVFRSKYFRQTLRTIASTPPGNCMVPQCTLCGCSCELPKKLREELHQLGTLASSDGASDDVLRVLSEYRMTLKMAISTLFQLRERGQSIVLWEHAALLLMNNPAGQASEFTVCYLCYRIYKSQLALSRVAQELNETYGVDIPPHLRPANKETEESTITTLSRNNSPAESHSDRMMALCSRIQRFYGESCVSFIQENGSPTRSRLALPEYAPVKGVDVDPTCLQLRLVFFFHELQDGGPNLSPSDFYLEYHFGQTFSRLDFDGSKRHTPNRWQLCEARVHYLLATTEGFGDYCNEKRLHIKMKTVSGSEYHGHTSLSLRPLISAAKWYSTSVQRESRTDYLLELKTDAFGLLTLKMTLGLLVDPVPLSQVRELIKDDDFLREGSLALFWPPPWFQSCSLPVPVDWVGALMPSEYVSIIPRQKRQNLADRRKIGLVRRGADNRSYRTLLHDDKYPPFLVDGAHQQQMQASSSVVDLAGAATAAGDAMHVLDSACAIAKRVIDRVTGGASTFPTVVLGQVLRHARYLSSGGSLNGIASWAEPAPFHLTRDYTIDNLTHDIDVESVAALTVVGEILLVLTRCQLAPVSISVANLERHIRPYWLLGQGESDDRTKELKFESVSVRVTSIPSYQRVVWNRALRRCQVAHFCGEFRAYTRATFKPNEQDHTRHAAISKYEEMQMLQRKLSYRAKMQAYLLCEIVEVMEAADTGLIDIAELRSLHKCMLAARLANVPPTPDLSFRNLEQLEMNDLEALSTVLQSTQHATEASFVECLMNSDRMTDALAEFDRFGAGTLNFDEFWELSDSVMKDLCSKYVSQNEEPMCMVFCLRHGTVNAFAIDRCCVMCSYQYQDHEFLPRKYSLVAGPVSPSSDSDSDVTSDSEMSGDEATQLQSANTVDKQHIERPGTARRALGPVRLSLDQGTSDESGPLDGDSLTNTLLQLKAAEWHVRYSRNSLDRTKLEAMLSARRSSSVASARRTSTVSNASDKSTRRPVLAPSFSVADFVTEAEERKQQAFSSAEPGARRTLITRKPKKRNKSKSAAKEKPLRKNKSSALHSTRLQNCHSLSTLLREELEHTSQCRVTSCDATRSTKLIDAVHRGEAKRHKLDRLVLAELVDVKQRLARLLASS